MKDCLLDLSLLLRNKQDLLYSLIKEEKITSLSDEVSEEEKRLPHSATRFQKERKDYLILRRDLRGREKITPFCDEV